MRRRALFVVCGPLGVPKEDTDMTKPKSKNSATKRKRKKRASPVRTVQIIPGTLHLLDKRQVCRIANTSYPAIWTWMRAGTFPRSRIVGGRSMWLSTDIEQWLATLPTRRLKGDAPEAAA
jgi:prophage regulatory protein